MSTVKVEQTVLESIKNRRSVYPEVFSAEAVTQEELELLLEMANYAPNHRLTQPWRFKVAAGDRKTDFAEAMVTAYEAAVPIEKQLPKKPRKLRKRAQKSSFMLAICMQRDPKASLPEWEELAAMSMAVQNIWLAGEALGIGMYWSSPGFMARSEIRDFLKLAEGEACYGLLFIGRKPEGLELVSSRTPIGEKVSWI